MNNLDNITISPLTLTMHGYQKHEHYDYYEWPHGDGLRKFGIQYSEQYGTWVIFMLAWGHPTVRWLNTLGQLNAFHAGVYDKPLYEF